MKRTFYVAGVQFRPSGDIKLASNRIKVGNRLSLEPEPTNKFDPNAVKIIYSLPATEAGGSNSPELFIGYVPKKFSSEVAGMLSIGAPVECIVDAVDPAAKTYEMFKVTVQIPIEEEQEEDDQSNDEGDQ